MVRNKSAPIVAPEHDIDRRETRVVAGPIAIILMGAAVAPATPVEPRTWFTSQENPKTALQVAERGAIPYTIDVAPDGKALRCATPGQTGLDQRVCELVMKRARFLPATDDRGQPAFAVYEGVASFLLPGKHERPDPAKLNFAVDGLPGGIASPAYAKVALLVDGAGAIRHCAATAGEQRRRIQVVEALGPTACAHLAKDYRPPLARDGAGAAVPSVQTVLVRLETRAPS